MLRGGGGGFAPGGIFFLLRIDSGICFFGQTMLVYTFFWPTDIVVEFFFLPDHVGGKNVLPKTFKLLRELLICIH